jgi:hypothetical protein
MLFCEPSDLNPIWATVAHATANNELGIAAKVAPKPGDTDSRQDRLICVYTRDFHDKADINRVLARLRELKLIETRGRPIYYKPGTFSLQAEMTPLECPFIPFPLRDRSSP